MSRQILIGLGCGVLMLATAWTPLPAEDATATIATVNDKPVTERDLQAMFLSRNVPESLQSTVRKAFVQRLVDNRLMLAFLKDQKVEPPADQIDAAVRRIRQQIKAQGGDPAALLKKRGLDEAALKRELWLPVAWNIFARTIVTDRQIRERFEQRPYEFDGTQVRASQIVLKLPRDADEAAKQKALKQLADVRGDVTARKLSFADAAKKFSQAPSNAKGGDVGFFAYRGSMPSAIATQAFRLKKGEMARPFLSPFGAHLLLVTDVKPGQLSLEDARPVIFRELAQRKWDEVVARQRKSARIEWSKKPDSN